MEAPLPAPLTSTQLSAIHVGHGHARFIDPETRVVYDLVAQTEMGSLPDEYIREKLAEARRDVELGDVADWNVEDLKQKLRC
jgi:hypothetical protein